MRVKLIYLAPYNKIIAKDEERVNLPANSKIIDLLDVLVTQYGDRLKGFLFHESQYPQGNSRLLKVSLILNNQLVDQDKKLKSGDKLKLFIAPTGG